MNSRYQQRPPRDFMTLNVLCEAKTAATFGAVFGLAFIYQPVIGSPRDYMENLTEHICGKLHSETPLKYLVLSGVFTMILHGVSFFSYLKTYFGQE